MNHRRTCALLLLLLPLGACASTGGTATVASPSAPAAREEKKPDLEALQVAERTAELEHQLAVLEMERSLKKAERDLEHARAELAMAEAELLNFTSTVLGRRVAEASLGLQSIRDRAQEAQEELDQIQIMYDEQDLDDMTAEFVVVRGRRNAERAAARIAIEESEFATLQEHTLPMEQRRLELAVERKRGAVVDAERSLEINTTRQEMSVDKAERALEEAREELAEAMDGATGEDVGNGDSAEASS